MKRTSRDRVSIELRGMRERVNALAATRQMTTAALARSALGKMLDDEGIGPRIDHSTATASYDRIVKVTLRLSAAHAMSLATRARSADVSQGNYVAGLIDGMPPQPLPPDHARAVAALVGSTDRLAALSSDLNAFMRLSKLGSSSEIDRYRAGVLSLTEDVRGHLAVAAALVAELRPARRTR